MRVSDRQRTALVGLLAAAGLALGVVLMAQNGGKEQNLNEHPTAGPVPATIRPVTATGHAPSPGTSKIILTYAGLSFDSKGTATAEIEIYTSGPGPTYVTITWAGSDTLAAGGIGSRRIKHYLLEGTDRYDLTEHTSGKLHCPAASLGITVTGDAGQSSAYSSIKSACWSVIRPALPRDPRGDEAWANLMTCLRTRASTAEKAGPVLGGAVQRRASTSRRSDGR